MTTSGPLAKARRIAVRVLLSVAASAVALLALIALNVAQPVVGLERFREPTIAVYVLVALALAVAPGRKAFARRGVRRAADVLGHPRFFPVAAGVMLALFLLAPVTRHLAFGTCSHDFSMIDEAIWHSHHGSFLYSPVLGRSFLSEHFSPILALLVPVHAVLPSPYVLLVAQGLVLWGAGLVVRRLALDVGWSLAVANLAFVAWMNHPMLLATLEYPVHMEAAYPLLAIGAYLAWRRGRTVVAAALVLLLLAVKEDAGIYLVGAGAWIALARRRPATGIALAVAGAAWTLVVLGVILPRISPDTGDFRFLGRWASWGDSPGGILLGFLRQPLAFARALAGEGPLRLFGCLLFLPFVGRWGWLLFALPWIVNATSDYGAQAGLGQYYGAPLLAFATIAAIEGSRSGWFRRLTGAGAPVAVAPTRAPAWIAPALAALLIVPNVAHFRYPRIDPDRRAILAAIAELPPREPVETLCCFWPVLGYERPKVLLVDPARPTVGVVLLRTHSTTWPFESAALEAGLAALRDSGWQVRFELNGTWLLEAPAATPSSSPSSPSSSSSSSVRPGD